MRPPRMRQSVYAALTLVGMVYGVGSVAMLGVMMAYDAPLYLQAIYVGLLAVCIVGVPVLVQLVELEQRRTQS